MNTSVHANATLHENGVTALQVPIDRIRAYDHNPRRSENPEYLRIKASIRSQGMDQPLIVTQRPGDGDYMVYAGGNTRLRAVKELYEETGDEAFYHIHCLLKPWQHESDALLAHLRENDLRGDLIFIDRAHAVFDVKRLLEQELNIKDLSQRQLQVLLKERGYGASPGLLSPMGYAVQTLLPILPLALQAGLGRPQVERIRALERAVRKLWMDRELGDDAAFDTVFAALCRRYDGPDWDLELLRRGLETEIAEGLEVSLHTIRLELEARLEGREFKPWISDPKKQDVASEQYPVAATTHISAEPPTSDRATPPHTNEPNEAMAVERAFQPSEPVVETDASADPHEHPSAPAGKEQQHPIAPLPTGDEPDTDLNSLRTQAQALAARLAQRNGLGELVTPLLNKGTGFVLCDVPDATLAEQLDHDTLSQISMLWWQLAACAEMTVAPLEAIVPALPEDSILRRALEQQDAGLLFNSVWTLDPGHTGYRLWRTLGERDWQDLMDLMGVYRRIHQEAERTRTPLWEG